ncbi:adenylate cyclase [Kaistella solincola]|uniref:Adenylate cyclase n=1 Tax=Kaistella solincola TaxID=510955 RepID=A0ABR4ZNQ4_9FLAO|nr:CYTH domain-containing protein [Kaistella solincola]KIA82381.1 adenylate cyclase [Kaistella solincola]
MGVEIERKFLVDKKAWQMLEKPAGEMYRQGYLLTDPAKTIRVQQTPDKGFLTIKGICVGATRAEFEYEIPFDEANELLDQFASTSLSKMRYKILVGNNLWEVDEFFGDNEGLIVAEIELKDEAELFQIPVWVEDEVTGDEKYYNSNLTLFPFTDWNKN